jgi:hypothetical protein
MLTFFKTLYKKKHPIKKIKSGKISASAASYGAVGHFVKGNNRQLDDNLTAFFSDEMSALLKQVRATAA